MNSFIAMLLYSLPIAFALAWCHSRVQILYRSVTVYRNTISTIHSLLNPTNSSPHYLLAARAVPNARLIRAFALTNTFVSADSTIHAKFVSRATSLVKTATERGSPHFQQVAMDAVDAALLDVDQQDFGAFVQDVTMRVALVGLLGVDATVDELDPDDISVVATHITLLWSLSKKPDPIPPHLLPKLNDHLRRLIPDEEAYPNPLDYLIPVWETLWRVVATTVAYAHRHALAGDVFSDLQRLPTTTQFRAFNESHPSVEWFVTEAMRLHPPSKHISRSSSFESVVPSFVGKYLGPVQMLANKAMGPLIHYECADIGTVLRSESIWGVDADRFDPLRYQPNRITPEQEKIKWLAFGHGRYKCIAAAWAPMAAGLIVAAILDRLKTDRRLVAGDSIGARDGWKGWMLSRCSGP